MTHFSVLIIGDNPEAQLAPYHQYECTGINDQYVQDVDCTSEFIEEYEFFSQTNSELSFREYLLEHSSLKEVKNTNDIDRKGIHQWGYFIETQNGDIKVFKRTNPNDKWDYYDVGPDSFFKLKGKKTNYSAKKSDIQFKHMMRWAKYHAYKEYDLYNSIISGLEKPKSIQDIRKSLDAPDEIALYRKSRGLYKTQEAIKALKAHPMFRDEVRCLVNKFNYDRESYAEYEALKLFACDATILDSQWYERLLGGWNNDMTQLTEYEWLKHTWKLISSLSDDTLISIYICHS
jgi:hypothetical protein